MRVSTVSMILTMAWEDGYPLVIGLVAAAVGCTVLAAWYLYKKPLHWTRALTHSDPMVRLHAAEALGDRRLSERESFAAVSALAETLHDPAIEVRLAAAFSLGEMGACAATAVPALAALLHEPDPELRAVAAFALGQMGPAASDAVPTLIDALRDPGDGVRANAAHALGSMGEAAKVAVPALAQTVHDTNHHVKKAATEAIQKIESET